MTNEQIQEKLKICHKREEELNKEIGICDKIIRQANIKKKSLANKISKNMIYCNQLLMSIPKEKP